VLTLIFDSPRLSPTRERNTVLKPWMKASSSSNRAVLLADFTNLATNRDGDLRRLDLTDQGGKLCTAFIVVALLLHERGERQVDQR